MGAGSASSSLVPDESTSVDDGGINGRVDIGAPVDCDACGGGADGDGCDGDGCGADDDNCPEESV